MNKACRKSAITRTTILVPDHFIEITKTFEIRMPGYEIDQSGNEEYQMVPLKIYCIIAAISR